MSCTEHKQPLALCVGAWQSLRLQTKSFCVIYMIKVDVLRYKITYNSFLLQIQQYFDKKPGSVQQIFLQNSESKKKGNVMPRLQRHSTRTLISQQCIQNCFRRLNHISFLTPYCKFQLACKQHFCLIEVRAMVVAVQKETLTVF